MGLAGTGSTDFTTTDTFVPEGRWVQVAGAIPVVDGPLWRFPFFGMLAAGVASVAIGIAAGAVKRFVEIAPGKTPQGSSRALAERTPAQADLSRAEATVRSSRAYLDQALGEAWEVAAQGDPLTVEHRRQIRQAAADAAQRCGDSLIRLHRQAGGSGVYLSEPLQRAVRDAQVAATHGMVAERIHELTGRLLLGLDTDTSLL
jgi:alkylation response protein AidB-like acyl-CoA dehydrogenase